MAKGVYSGIDGLAQKVKKMYVGVDGVARKVKKGYIGIDGVARQFFSGAIVTHPTVALTANSSNGYVVTCLTTYNSNYPAWKAFNKTYSDKYGWRSNSNDDEDKWIALQMPQALKNIKIGIANVTDSSSAVNGVINASVQGSNNGSSWTTIGTISGRNGTTSALLTEHQCEHETAYKHVRLYVTKWQTNENNEYLAIGEIYITGEPEE